MFVKEEYEYCFGVIVKDRDMLPPGLYDRFQNKVSEYFRSVDSYRIRNYDTDPTFKNRPIELKYEDDDGVFVPSIEYIEGNIRITAKKFGLTYLDVKVEIGKTNHGSETNDDHLCEEYDDCPF